MTLLLLLSLEVVQAAPDIMQGVDIVALAKAQRPGCLVWGGSQSEPGTNQISPCWDILVVVDHRVVWMVCLGSPGFWFPTSFSVGLRARWGPKYRPEQISNWRNRTFGTGDVDSALRSRLPKGL